MFRHSFVVKLKRKYVKYGATSILVLVHMKDGVGETTSAALLCAAAHVCGTYVTLIDFGTRGAAIV